MNEGYVFIAYGEKYIKQSIEIVKSIKKFDAQRKFILISNVKLDLFDETIDISDEFKNESNNHNKYCILARILTPKYIKLDKFLMIDTDMLCINNINNIWDEFNKSTNCCCCIGGRDGKKWHWGEIENVNKYLKMDLKPMHGGLLFFNKKHKNFNEYYNFLMEAYFNYDKFKFKRQFRGNAMTDEILFSYANAKLNYIPYDFVKYPFVSFNLNDNIDIKKKIVSWGTKDTTFLTDKPTILIHFTGLNDGPEIDILYKKWINKIK